MATASEKKAIEITCSQALNNIKVLSESLDRYSAEFSDLVDIYKKMETGSPLPMETVKEIAGNKVVPVYGKRPAGESERSGNLLLPTAAAALCVSWRSSAHEVAGHLEKAGYTIEGDAINRWLEELDRPTDDRVIDSDFLLSEETAAGHVRDVFQALAEDSSSAGNPHSTRDNASSDSTKVKIEGNSSQEARDDPAVADDALGGINHALSQSIQLEHLTAEDPDDALPEEIKSDIAGLPPDNTLDLRPTYRRDHLWLAWNKSADGFGPAKIRDKWNGLPEEHRKLISPRAHGPIGGKDSKRKKAGSEVVKQALRKAKNAREQFAGNVKDWP